MQLTSIYKLLSDETRLRVILLIASEELCVCELVGVLDIPQPKISKVLSKLRDLDLVEDTRKEKFVFYSLKKNNPLLNRNISYIMENLAAYPQIQEDLHRVSNKNCYIDQSAQVAISELNS